MTVPVSGIGLMDLLYAALTIIVGLIANWCWNQEYRLRELEIFRSEVLKNYVSKAELKALGDELKHMLNRIDDKIERFRKD